MSRLLRSAATLSGLIAAFCLAVFLGDRQKPHQESSGALQALDFWTQSRAYPQHDIPADRYVRAFEELRGMVSEQEAVAGSPLPWTSLGPVNFCGRMISIAINPRNPNAVYVGAASGGLWRSRTGGLAGDWQHVPTGFPVLGVNAIAIHPADTNTIYIGTGELYRYNGSTGGIVIRTTRGSYGFGILKTTNNGVTWAKSLDWTYNQQRGVQALKINPRNPSTVFAATSEGVYRTTNAGGAWNPVLNVLLAQDIAIHPVDTTLVLATCGNFGTPGAGIYRSTDGGSSFAQVGGLPSFSGKGLLEIFGANPNTVYASLADSINGGGYLYRSVDFGASWTLVSSQTVHGVQGWYSHYVAVHPTDSSQIVRGGQTLFKSTNGGVSSFSVSGPWADHHAYAHHPTNPSILYIVDDGGVWRSTNFGSSYQAVNGGLLTSQFYNGFSQSATDSLFAAGQVQDHFGYIYRGSTSWEYHASGMDEVGWTAINQSNDLIMYTGNRGGGTVFKSTNRGVSFFGAGSGLTGGDACWNTPFVLSRSDPNVLYFGRSIIFKSTNAAASWAPTNGGVPLNGNPALSMAVAPTNQDTVFVGTVPGTGAVRIFRTANGGTSWQDVTGNLPNRYPMDIAIDPTDARKVYVAFGGFDTTRLARSTDGGLTWAHFRAGLPNVPTTAVAVDPLYPGNVYVGTDLGVMASTDAGSTWMTFNEGLFEAVIAADLVVSPSNRSIRLASHSHGVFTRGLLPGPVTGIEQRGDEHAAEFVLHQNYPNPFNPSTHLGFGIRELGLVSLKVYDVLGREIATLVNEVKPRGRYSVQWDATGMASGAYLYALELDGKRVAVKKAILMR